MEKEKVKGKRRRKRVGWVRMISYDKSSIQRVVEGN